MIVNRDNLNTLYVAYSAAFQGALGQAEPQWNRVAMEIPSTTAENEYGWFDQLPGVREWVAERQIKNVSTEGFKIRNKTYENSFAVPREAIEDDRVGLYTPMFTEMGRAAGALPDQLVFSLLNAGFSSLCYDGQFFFDNDHPVELPDGTTGSWSNSGGGGGTPWFLLDTSRAIRPIIYQPRRPFELTRMDSGTDEAVFMRKEFRYGTDGRCAAGYGLPQFAYGSRQTLDATAYANARATMMALKGDGGRPLGIRPTLLVVPPALESAGRTILQAEMIGTGSTNIWRGSAELMVVPWLAQ